MLLYFFAANNSIIYTVKTKINETNSTQIQVKQHLTTSTWHGN